jgi:hypothetical protein
MKAEDEVEDHQTGEGLRLLSLRGVEASKRIGGRLGSISSAPVSELGCLGFAFHLQYRLLRKVRLSYSLSSAEDNRYRVPRAVC